MNPSEEKEKKETAPPPEGAAPDAGVPDGGAPADGAPAATGASAVADAPAPEDTSHESAVQEDLDELVATSAQRDEYLALAQRTQADFENYRKRMTREVSLSAERGAARLATELLPALDNLERALAAAEDDEGPPTPLADGVRLVAGELTAALGRAGIESFRPDGEQFDPQLHEAMASQPVDGADPGVIVEVYQSGYRLGDTVIRPARVVVAA